MKTRAVLFDFGGTLLSYNREEIFRSLLAENGVSVTKDAVFWAYQAVENDWYKQLETRPVNDEALEQLDLMLLEQLGIQGDTKNLALYVRKNWWRMEEQLPAPVVRQAYPDALSCLRELRERGMKMGIVSNIESEERLRKELRLIGLSEFFPVLVASGTVGVAKPAREIFKLAADQLGVQPGETIFVGDDYERDYLGSHGAGMKPILLDRNGNHVDKAGYRLTTLKRVPLMLWIEGPYWDSPGAEK